MFLGTFPKELFLLISALRRPSCTINEWNNEIMMTQLYKHHLYKFTPSSTPWYEFLLNWKEQKCNIIELFSALKYIYPEGINSKKENFVLGKHYYVVLDALILRHSTRIYQRY
jgi:hypothetical protein